MNRRLINRQKDKKKKFNITGNEQTKFEKERLKSKSG